MRNSKCEIRNARSRAAFTLVEVLIVVAILALLAAALVGVSSFITTQRNTALTKNCLDVLDAALAEFRDITGHYPVDDWGVRDTSPGCLIAGATLTSASAPRSSELLYLQLSLLPQTRDIIAKLPDQLLVQPIDTSDILITVELADQPGTPTPYLRRIVDAWETPLNYDLGENPPIWSSGPDKETGTAETEADDIK